MNVAEGQYVKNVAVWLMPTAVVSGEIVDEFNDGLQNVEVKLLARHTKLGRMYLQPAGKSVTDDRGQYRISGLRPGKYYLAAEYKPNGPAMQAFKIALAEKVLEQQANGNQAQPLKAMPPDNELLSFTFPALFYPGSGDFQQAQAIQLNPGDEVAANFLFVSAPVVSITGRITNGMTGAHATRAVVAAYWTDYVEGEALEGKVSPQDGTFEIKDVAPGFYKLRASFTEDGQTYQGEQEVEVGYCGAQNIEIAGLPDFAIAGHVSLISDGKTVQKPNIVEFVGEGMIPRVRTGVGAPEFKFDAQLRPEHRYRVNVINLPDDYYLKSVLLSGQEMPADNLVVNGRRGDMELILSPAGGRITGTILDNNHQPTRGSVLLVPDVADPGPPELFRRKSAGSDGKFVFRGVPPGSYRLLAMESPELEDQVNDPDFGRKVVGRGDSISVAESGKYTVSVRLTTDGH